jgi:putative transposase
LLGWDAERKGVKASKFTGAQKAFIIMQGEECATVAKTCRMAGSDFPSFFLS